MGDEQVGAVEHALARQLRWPSGPTRAAARWRRRSSTPGRPPPDRAACRWPRTAGAAIRARRAGRPAHRDAGQRRGHPLQKSVMRWATCRRASDSRPARMASSSRVARRRARGRPRRCRRRAGARRRSAGPHARCAGDRRSRSGPLTWCRASARDRAVRRQARAGWCRYNRSRRSGDGRTRAGGDGYSRAATWTRRDCDHSCCAAA